jgi:hypothetical protein
MKKIEALALSAATFKLRSLEVMHADDYEVSFQVLETLKHV